MTREDVIKGLVRCIEKQDTVINRNHGFNCNACPYIRRCESIGYLIGLPLMRDALALLKAQEPITGETSDGYHTFNELYHHRAVLFSVIVANYPDRAWKSKKHHDGTMYDNMFIVGIDTPDGQATYHYDVDPYWDMFKCRVLDNAPEWDGHTPAQAIERIGKLKAQEPQDDDADFMTNIICEICDYAVKNEMEPNDTLLTISDNIKALLKISTFNNWKVSERRDGDA